MRVSLIQWAMSFARVRSFFSASVSGDDASYLAVCREAVRDPSVFATFRRHPDYTSILEHVSDDLGRSYAQLLAPQRRAAGALLDIARADTVGGPRTLTLAGGATLSPTTLRYLKVADDLERLFGNLDGWDVVEIGVGYGGQCRVLDSLFQLRSYTLVDLRPVLHLADAFLNHFPLRTSVSFKTMNELSPSDYHLAISNYAFSELNRELQETYWKKAIARSARGYMTINSINPDGYDSLSASDMATRLGATRHPEEPLTHPHNEILVWGAA